MNDLNRTNKELLKELQDLKKEYDTLKSSYDNDIKKCTQVEDALLESKAKYQAIFESTGTATLIVEEDTTILMANKECQSITGYTPDELMGHKWVQYVAPDCLQEMLKNHQLRRQNPDLVPKKYEVKLINKKGEVRYAFLDIGMIPDTKQSVVSILDFTDRKRVEEALIHEQDLMSALMDNIPDHIYFKDTTSRFFRNSRAHVQSFGLTDSNQLVGKSDFDFFVKEVAQRQYEDEQEIIRTGQSINKEEFTTRNDNSVNWYYSTKMPLRNKDGKIIGTFGISRDITERKRAEKELIIAKEHAEESDRLKSTFLANMSHEIRTPMNGILGFAHLLTEPNLTGEEQQEYIRIIEKSGVRMLNIIHDIVDISKIESGQMETTISATDINKQIEYLFAFFKPEAERKGIQLSVKNNFMSKEAIICTDREKIYAILTNLVGNAIKFTCQGTIELGYEKKDKFLEFFVKDTGVGIHRDQTEIIFERFRQGNDLITRPYEGTGLGLSISKAYVEMLGGKIWVESELGKGSIFYFTIPYNAEKQTKFVIGDLPSGIAAVNQGKKLKILVVEDDETSETLITTMLKKDGTEFLYARTGIEGVEVCRKNPDINLVLMDIRMPEMDGYEATRQIRQFNKDLVIIAQTAYALTGDREKAIEAGCNDYIAKPFNCDALKELIQKHFNK
ncbi:MAG: PAS domain S-box protein [Bacteroidetes bacterium]|nr:PAS domain S-box protein [Bacteroidota bacterium]